MPEFISNLHEGCPERAIEDSFDKLPEPDSEQHLKFFNVRFSDLDMNQHVNHVNYIEWGLESVPKDISKSYMLTGIEISFKAESNYGNRVKSIAEVDGVENSLFFKHRLTRESDNKELARMKSSWRTRKK